MFGIGTSDSWLWQAAAWWLPILLDAAIKGTVVLGIAAMVVLRMRRASAAARHLAWCLGMASLLLLPALSVALPAWQVLPSWLSWNQPAAVDRVSDDLSAEPMLPGQLAVAWTPDHFAEDLGGVAPLTGAAMEAAPAGLTEVGAEVAVETERGQIAPSAGSHSTTAGVLAAALGVWLAGAMACLLPAGIALWSLWRLGRQCDPLNDGPWPAMIGRLAGELGIRRGIAVLCSPARRMPMVWGVFRPKLLIPADAHGWSAGRLRAVLLHELAHIRRRDCLVHWMTQIVRGLYWFHPLVWVAARRIVAEGERACDDAALTRGVKPSDYAEHLLHIAGGHRTRRLESAAAIAMARSSRLESRFLAILDPGRNRRTVGLRARWTCIGVVAAVACLLAVLQPGPALQAQTAAQPDDAREAAGETAPAATKQPEGSDAEVRYAKKAVEIAELEYRMSLEANRIHPGSIAASEIRKLAAKVQEATLDLDRAEATLRGDKPALAKIAVRHAKNALSIAELEYQMNLEANRIHPGSVSASEIRRSAAKRQEAALELERAEATLRGDKQALAEIAVRRAKKGVEIAELEYRMNLEANRIHPGSVSELEIRRSEFKVLEADLVLEEAKHGEVVAKADKVRYAQTKLDFLRSEYKFAVDRNNKEPNKVNQAEVERLKAKVKEAELELEKLTQPALPGDRPRAGGDLSLAEAIRAVNEQAAKTPESRVQKPLAEDEVVKAIEELVRDEKRSPADRNELKQIAATRRLPKNAAFRQFVRYNDGTYVEHGWWVRLILLHDNDAPLILPIRREVVFRRPCTQKERLFQVEVRRTGIPLINRLVACFDEDPKFSVVQQFTPQEADRLAGAVKKAINDRKADDLLKTYEWGGVDKETRAAVSSEAEQFVKRHLSSVAVSPRRFGGRLTHWQGFQTWDPNLPVLGYVVLEFADKDEPKSVSLEFGEAQGKARLVNYIVSQDDRARLVGKPLPSPIGERGFPAVRLEDGWFELCFQIDAADELPALQNANLELWKVQLDLWKDQPTPQPEPSRAEKREPANAPKGGAKTDAGPATEASPQRGDLPSDVAARIRDNYARLGGIDVTVESVHVSPGVPKRRVQIFKTAQNDGMFIEQPRSEERRHCLIRGENFRSEPEGDERDVWVRDKDVWTQYVESSHTAWVRYTDQMPGESTLDPREIGGSNGELGFLGQLKASKVVETKEVTAVDGRRLLDVLLEKTTGRSKGMRYRASFDRSRNSLPVAVEYFTREDKPMLTFAISYQEVLPGSAWFLREATETFVLSGSTATTRVLGEVRHHQPIPDAAFTIDFPAGTQVRDSAHRVSFRVNGPQKPDTDTLLKAGDQAPDFQFTATDGQTYQVKGLLQKGKIVLIYFFSLGGGMELRSVEELWQRFKSEGLVVLAIGRDCDSDELLPFRDHLQLTLPLGGDPRREIYGKFARKGIPRLYLVGPDGKIVHQSSGRDGALSQLADRVEANLRASRDPGPKT